MMPFATSYPEILAQLDCIEPIKYGETRNYLTGSVTRLSPYISRGVISTKQIAKAVLAKGYQPAAIDSFLKELAWRDYFKQVWIALGNDINKDIKQPQPNYTNAQISVAIAKATTGINAIDTGITELLNTGYMHNHLRMYVASIACNVALSHWQLPAQWMYYHLLDADWASNALSWQWVAGSFSNKKYIANQENINKYCNSAQTHTFLDTSYDAIRLAETPKVLHDLITWQPETILPVADAITIQPHLPTYIYNFYNLDPVWDSNLNANRILLLEPSFFKQYAVCAQTIDFVIALSKNIPNLQHYVAEFDALLSQVNTNSLHYKEHPTNRHYKGVEHARDWMYENVKGYYPSFFAYWKQCQKALK